MLTTFAMDDSTVIDNDVLISLVEARPVLWDKTLDAFKDRNATRDAWREVCCALKEDFDNMEDKEKNAFGKVVTKRWGNLRDAFSKSKKKIKDCKKSGAGAPNIKRYVYADQMQFLNKLYQSREVAESLEVSGDNIDDEDADNEQPLEVSVQETEGILPRKEDQSRKSNTSREHKKRRHPDEVELKMLKALEQPTPSAHMSFFQGLLPHLNKFNDGEVLEFQMGVLEVISKINNKQKIIIPPPPPPQTPSYYHHNYPFPQSQTYHSPQPQTSHSNQFNSNNNFHSTFSPTHPFHNPINLNHSDSNNQQVRSSKKQLPESQQEQTTAQYYQQFGHCSTVTSPETYPSESPSPSASVCTDLTYDFS